MALIITHNILAMTVARNLSAVYKRMGKSIERLSSGLRINSAADDPAGMAVRSKMRTDIRVMAQSIRNAADSISLLQTAEGALSIIDEKLIRMKELAEQAATGTYTTQQRAIINSEYQAMAAEIDRIANATTFNGIYLLDGSMFKQHQGSGLKVHFGLGNDPATDYYFIGINDTRATQATGLRVGNSDARDTLRSTALSASSATAPLSTAANGANAKDGFFGIRYTEDFDAENPDAAIWNLYGYVSIDASRTSINDIVQNINLGAQANGNFSVTGLSLLTGATLSQTYLTINGQVFGFASISGNGTYSGTTGTIYIDSNTRADASSLSAQIAAYLNDHAAQIGVYGAQNGSTIQLISTQFGVQGNYIETFSSNEQIIAAGQEHLSGGGRQMLTASAFYDETSKQWQLQIQMNQGGEKYQVQLFGFASVGQAVGAATIMAGLISGVNFTESDRWMSQLYTTNPEYGDNGRLNTYQALRDIDQWQEPQNGAGTTQWDGADVLTQTSAQYALSALDAAIQNKDTTRANLGILQNRLESTITLMQIQMENLQAAESRISDVDVAMEMAELIRAQLVAQVATAMLAQANSLPQLILRLITDYTDNKYSN